MAKSNIEYFKAQLYLNKTYSSASKILVRNTLKPAKLLQLI